MLDETSSPSDTSGPEQFRMHSSMVSKLLALPAKVKQKCKQRSKRSGFNLNLPVQPPKMNSLQMPSLVSK